MKASGETVLTGEKEESRVGGRGGEASTGRAIRWVVGRGVEEWTGGGRRGSTTVATRDDSLSKSSAMGGALWQKQKQFLQPLLEITRPGTFRLEPETSLWLPTPRAPSAPIELRCHAGDRPRTPVTGLPWAPRPPAFVCMCVCFVGAHATFRG